MKHVISLAATLFLLPILVYAQGLQTFFKNLIDFSNKTLIPFIFGIAFLFFVINTIRYFVIGGGNEESQEKAKDLALYGVLAFVLIIVFWGIVNLVASSIGLDGKTAPTPDYVESKSQRT